MQIKNEINDVLHRIRVKLYPNNGGRLNDTYAER
jgi:hypothetical protein